MIKTLQYYWNAARGYRFKPWESPYVRWRCESFLGKKAPMFDGALMLISGEKPLILPPGNSFTSPGSTASIWNASWTGPRKDAAFSAVATPEARTHTLNKRE